MQTGQMQPKHISDIIDKIFSDLDEGHKSRFCVAGFRKVIKVITKFMGVDDALEDDVEDIFNLLDVNGD